MTVVVECGKCRSKIVTSDCWTGHDVLAIIPHEAGCPNAGARLEPAR